MIRQHAKSQQMNRYRQRKRHLPLAWERQSPDWLFVFKPANQEIGVPR
jgi:hypothetical protein